MQNAYLVDVFLSFWAWLILALLYTSVMTLVEEMNANITDTDTFLMLAAQVFKPAVYLSLPCIGLFMFLLWRFAQLMILAQCFGAGGIGLLFIMAGAAVIMIWLKILLVLIKHRYINQAKPSAQQAPPNAGAMEKYDTFGRAL